KLAERAALLSSFPQHNPNPILELDAQSGRTYYANPSAQMLFSDITALGLKHPFLSGVRAASAEITAGSRTPAYCEMEFHGSIYAQTISYVSETDRLRVYTIDITERKRIEE